MAWDKRKVVVQCDNETRHSPRQKCARPLVQSQNGVVISKPTERHVTRQAKHVKAKTKARFDHPTTKRTEAMYVKLGQRLVLIAQPLLRPPGLLPLLHIHGQLPLL